MSNKLTIFGSDRKNGRILRFSGKISCLKGILGYDKGKEGGKSRHLFAK